MDGNILVIAVLGVIALSAGLFVIAGGSSAERNAAKRVTAVSARAVVARRGGAGSAADPADRRRKQVAETLKDLERKAAQAKARPTTKQLIEQAGLDLPVSRFWLFSAICGAVIGFLVFAKTGTPLAGAGAAFAAGLGLPRWVLGFLRGRRQKAFLVEFANAIDVIVRGVKSGLPLNDCLRMIGQESPDPVGGEFRLLVENQRVGLPLEDCLKRFLERMPLPEVNFFQIVLTIQQKSGGNLSEALGNLSLVLRDRKRLQGKIKALSSEAKASASIIGSLPLAVMLLVSLFSPNYLDPLFSERTGNIMLAGCAIWMFLGVLVMKKMIDFRV